MLQRIRTAKEEGFTLIELLIVIIILGILAAIVVFAVGTTRKDSVNATCKTDVKSIQLAAEAVKTKSGAYPATATGAGNLNGGKNLIATQTTTDGQVLKAWPGGAAATDELYFTYAKTAAGYDLGVDGKNLPTSTLDQDATDAQVETACTST